MNDFLIYKFKFIHIQKIIRTHYRTKINYQSDPYNFMLSNSMIFRCKGTKL